jgi:hypothetical protein
MYRRMIIAAMALFVSHLFGEENITLIVTQSGMSIRQGLYLFISKNEIICKVDNTEKVLILSDKERGDIHSIADYMIIYKSLPWSDSKVVNPDAIWCGFQIDGRDKPYLQIANWKEKSEEIISPGKIAWNKIMEISSASNGFMKQYIFDK